MNKALSRRKALQVKYKSFRRGWYRFSRNPLSILGLVILLAIIFVAICAPYVAPYPEHAGRYVCFKDAKQPPSLSHLCGTDVFGRDILSRSLFGFRFSLIMGIVVLALVVPVGVLLGIIAGYMKGTWVETLIMRVTDVFVSVPALVLALAICSVLTPNVLNAMLAVSLMWWPWYTRLVYGLASSLRNEFFVQASETAGMSKFYILFKEILPNCLSPVFTKMALDLGVVIILGASLSFVGLGVQPPKPGLGTMVADGAKYLPDLWWIAMFPALAIVFVVMGFNLVGDGIRDVLTVEEA